MGLEAPGEVAKRAPLTPGHQASRRTRTNERRFELLSARLNETADPESRA
jgi:hypothetical protein